MFEIKTIHAKHYHTQNNDPVIQVKYSVYRTVTQTVQQDQTPL